MLSFCSNEIIFHAFIFEVCNCSDFNNLVVTLKSELTAEIFLKLLLTEPLASFQEGTHIKSTSSNSDLPQLSYVFGKERSDFLWLSFMMFVGSSCRIFRCNYRSCLISILLLMHLSKILSWILRSCGIVCKFIIWS